MTNPFWIAPFIPGVALLALLAGGGVLRLARRLARERGCGKRVPCGPSCECAADAMDTRS